MKKVLIWDNFPLQNVGGASGYLYNLHEYLSQNPCPQIVFLSDLIKNQKVVFKKEGRLGRLLEKHLPCLYTNVQFVKLSIHQPVFPLGLILDSFDFIHFHLISQVLQFRELYPNYKGKIIVTSHCPCPLVDELLADDKRLLHGLRFLALKNEILCYNQADYWMFPCKESREPYEKEESINSLFSANEHKFFYVPSAIIDKNNEKISDDLLLKVGIPEDAFIIAFMGRHEAIKGYDLLKVLGVKLLDIIPNLYFICAGLGSIEPLSHPRWIELGQVNNVEQWMSVADAYISLNRDTYFDLVILEALRAGLSLFVSNTGGNKFLYNVAQEESVSITCFDFVDIETVVRKVGNLVALKYSDIKLYKQVMRKNRMLFENRFRVSTYVDNYLSSIEALS